MCEICFEWCAENELIVLSRFFLLLRMKPGQICNKLFAVDIIRKELLSSDINLKNFLM